MGTTQPIKKNSEIEKLRQYFYDNGEIRNYTLITLGINTALRISDLLQLTWRDVWNFERQCFREHLIISEQKTDKTANIYLNEQCRKCLAEWKRELSDGIYPSEYIFKSRVGNNKPIGRNRAYVIIKKAWQNLGGEGNISCHSLRKTFGYHAWKQGVSPAVIMSIYNHSSMEITKRYLSIEQDDKDEVFKNITF
ncbi:MAG: tyrosine-type recombinase/integrase [Blautia sp.]|nr:tyrosine-type recombinase/integrase [Lachnoclostridium sp.]MCM1212191.1 tyrosine-type recombinase/integrase [Blautia sp.]